MVKLSEIKNDELVIVIGEESDKLIDAFTIKEGKELFVGKEMYTAKISKISEGSSISYTYGEGINL